MSSGVTPKADIALFGQHVSNVPLRADQNEKRPEVESIKELAKLFKDFS
jgi:hypothetical protein